MLLADANGPVATEEVFTPVITETITQTATAEPYVYNGILPKQQISWAWWVLVLAVVLFLIWLITKCCKIKK